MLWVLMGFVKIFILTKSHHRKNMRNVVREMVSTGGCFKGKCQGFQPMPMPNLQDFEERLFLNFKIKGKIVSRIVITEIDIYCYNIDIILLI
jgi:hypothetical protein